MLEAWLLEVVEVPQPPLSYERFVTQRFLWRELGVAQADMTYAEVQEAIAFSSLEKQHPHRFQERK